MKAHLGNDSRTKLIHAAVATPANVADSTVLSRLLHGKEIQVCGDQAYRGKRAVPGTHQRPKISSIAAIATAVWPMRSSGEKPHQVQGAGIGRACDWGHQTSVRICQGALSQAR
jgi:hypothetical protein